MLSLLFNAGEGRSQVIIVHNNGEVAGSHWATISTAVAKIDQVNLQDLMLRNGRMVVGGLGLFDDGLVVYKYAVRLDDLDVDEFEAPAAMAVHFGDELERQLSGQDTY